MSFFLSLSDRDLVSLLHDAESSFLSSFPDFPSSLCEERRHVAALKLLFFASLCSARGLCSGNGFVRCIKNPPLWRAPGSQFLGKDSTKLTK